MVDARLNEDVLFIALPKNSVVEILGDKFAVGEYLRVQNVLPASSNSSSLPPDIDKCVSDALVTSCGRSVISTCLHTRYLVICVWEDDHQFQTLERG